MDNMPKYRYAMTTGEMIQQLLKWPLNTSLVVDVSNVVENPAGEYQWHNCRVVAPSQAEIDNQLELKYCESTYTTIKLDPEIQGC